MSDRRVAKKKQKRFNGQTWPKDLKISFLNRFCRDKKTVTNSLKVAKKKKIWLQREFREERESAKMGTYLTLWWSWPSSILLIMHVRSFCHRCCPRRNGRENDCSLNRGGTQNKCSFGATNIGHVPKGA